VEIDGLDFLLNKGSWNLLDNEFIAATTLPYPQKLQVPAPGTTQGTPQPEGLSNDEGTASRSPEVNITTEDPTRQECPQSTTPQPSVVNEKHSKIGKANNKIALATLQGSQESQSEKQMVEVERVIGGRPSLTPYTLRVGDTLELDGSEGVSGKGDGTFQAVVRYRVKLSKAVDSQERATEG
jgi:hypothetical protein